MRELSDISIQYVKGVGPTRKRLFMRLGVESVEDLLYFLPFRYEDRRDLIPIAKLEQGKWQSVSARIRGYRSRRSWYTKKHVTELVIEDGTGELFCVWFNQPYLESYFKPGSQIVCYGKVDIYNGRLQMVSPEYEIIERGVDASLSLGRIVPVYPLTKGMRQRFIRKVVMSCIERYRDALRDELPVYLRNKYRLYNIKRSIENIHFPQSFDDQQEALRRISFEEFFFFQVSVLLRRLSITSKKGISHQVTDTQLLEFINSFPFELTGAQKRVISTIRRDMQRATPMLRLLQGDVGSGKTLVAFFGCFLSFLNGHQSCIMAPTEILARQHYDNITHMIADSPMKDMRVALLVSSMRKKQRDSLLEDISVGKIDLLIGTHALINEDVVFKDLSFVVIDEQHKFGVRQRAMLAEKGSNPDILIMTATPIPRTLYMSLYGDLDVSILDELPPGRGKIKTMLFSYEREQEVYSMVKSKVEEGRQAYFIYPIIEGSENLDIKTAQEMFERFKCNEFKGLRLGMVHGKMKRSEIDKVMSEFKTGNIDILIATTVLEVGIDVVNASVMVIEHAERFGLSQLHQLRGRIGRGGADGYCFLLANPSTEEAEQRLEAIVSTNDGFKIAQQDLMIRGPGRYFGRHQHGLNELKVVNTSTEIDILETARKEAIALVEDDPKLCKGYNKRIREVIRRRYPTYLAMVSAG